MCATVSVCANVYMYEFLFVCTNVFTINNARLDEGSEGQFLLA